MIFNVIIIFINIYPYFLKIKMRIAGMYVRAVEFLITVNIIVFLFTAANYRLFELFALMPIYVLKEPWTLITSMFTHANFEHLLFNMVGLFFLGSYLERIIGENNFLKVYFIGGLFGGILSVITGFLGFWSIETRIVGASGAVFAVAACLAILRPNLTIFIFPIPFPMPLYIAVFGFMLIMSFMPGIAWSGHLGGLIVGALYGIKFRGGEIGVDRYGYRFY